jgi:hypothetical protein
VKRRLRSLGLLAVVSAALVAAVPAGAADECDGFMVCVPISGPWVVVPTGGNVPREQVEFQLTCPRGHIAGGLDARLSRSSIDVLFLGTTGSPVNPGISTSRSVVFVATYVGRRAGGVATFKPFVGCIPATGGGGRVPTSAAVVKPGRPIVRRVKTVRVRPGTATVAQGCAAREHLVGAAHAFGFYTSRPPDAGLVSSVSGSRSVSGGRVRVTVRGDAELAGVRAVVQVQALCSRVSA